MKRYIFIIYFGYIFSFSIQGQSYMNSDVFVQKTVTNYLEMSILPPYYVFPFFVSANNLKTAKLTYSGELFFSHQFYSHHIRLEPDNTNNGLDYIKNYLSLPPFASISLELLSAFNIGAGHQAQFKNTFSGNYFDEAPPISPQTVDASFTQKAYLYYANPAFTLFAGRDKIHIGPIHGSSLYYSDTLPWLDSIRLFIPFGNFLTYYWHTATIPLQKSSYQTDFTLGDDAGKDSPEYYYGFENDTFPTRIVDMFQRLEFHAETFRIGFALHTIIARNNNYMELSDFIPFMDWHAADVIPNNMAVLLDTSFVPFKNILISAQLGFDEINGNSIGVGDTSIPTIWAVTGNIAYMRPQFTAVTDLGYTSRLWGNFTGDSTGLGGINGLARAIYRHHTDSPMLIPLTSPYGPAAFWISQDITCKGAGNMSHLTYGISALFLIKETNSNLIDTPYKNVDNTKDISKFMYASAAIPLQMTIHFFTINLKPSIHIRNSTIWFECFFGVKATYSSFITL